MRNDLIDMLRGIAFILMFIHHIFYFNPEFLFTVPDTVSICGIISRTIFMILVGVSIGMFKNSKKEKSKKPYKTLTCALLVTITTKLFLQPNRCVFFGTLHFISFVTILLQEFDFGIREAIIGIISSFILSDYMLKLEPSDNYFKLILGSYTKTKWPLDIFPIFKWLPYVFFGLIIGKYMKDHNLEAQIDYVQPLTYIGKNTLFFYMLHIIPCIIWSSNFINYI
tara:strand:- start:29 stop:700 length:672 start_codon:yes stop_codon:yes gene_type:complete